MRVDGQPSKVTLLNRTADGVIAVTTHADLATWWDLPDKPTGSLAVDGSVLIGLALRAADVHTVGVDLGDVLVAVSAPVSTTIRLRMIE
jgi:hypothetical protein